MDQWYIWTVAWESVATSGIQWKTSTCSEEELRQNVNSRAVVAVIYGVHWRSPLGWNTEQSEGIHVGGSKYPKQIIALLHHNVFVHHNLSDVGKVTFKEGVCRQ